MKRSAMINRILPLYAIICAACIPMALKAEVEMRPKEVGASIDFGQIKSGHTGNAVYDDQTLTRTGVYLTTSGIYNKNLDVRITIGGLFWYPLTPGEHSAERLVRFGPGVGQAQGIYSYGNPENPSAKLHFGLFSEKYTDATNLGEYLFRSGTYPGYLVTGGWSYINSASYLAQGVKLILPTFGGMVTHEFTLFMERDYEPTSDISPGYLLTVKPLAFLEFGAGIVWSHAISLNPDRLAPKDTVNNGYSKITNLPILQATDSVTKFTPRDHPDQVGFYTFRGFKTMARASIDIGPLFGNERIHAGDFKLYTEMAILGVQDQPYYYDDIKDRMPIMVGINLPTFGLLNKLSIEGEYYKHRFPNTVGMPFYYALPLPLNQNDSPNNYPDSLASVNKSRFWHWSVYGSRKITQGITLFAQAASDHQRHPNGAEVKPTEQPPTITAKDWYYVVRLDFGLF